MCLCMYTYEFVYMYLDAHERVPMYIHRDGHKRVQIKAEAI